MEDSPLYMPTSTLGEWSVSLSVYKGTERNTAEFVEEDIFLLFINNHSDEFSLLCSPWPGRRTKYVIKGSRPEILFLGMVLNSDFTRMQLSLQGKTRSITLRVLRELIIPEVTKLQLSMGGLLEIFLMVAAQPLYDSSFGNNEAMEDNVRNLVQPTVDLLTLFQNYYVEELFVPEAYHEHGVSIIEGWYEVNKELPSVQELEETGSDAVSALFKTLILKGKRLMRDFNRMKLIQSKTVEAASNKLRGILEGGD